MGTEYEIHHRESGSLGENDEYWTLIVGERGEKFVRYDAAWGNPYRGSVKRNDPIVTPLDDFLRNNTSGAIGDNLNSILATLGARSDA